MGIVNCGLNGNSGGVDEFFESRAIGIEAVDDHGSMNLLQGSDILAIPPQIRAFVADAAL